MLGRALSLGHRRAIVVGLSLCLLWPACLSTVPGRATGTDQSPRELPSGATGPLVRPTPSGHQPPNIAQTARAQASEATATAIADQVLPDFNGHLERVDFDRCLHFETDIGAADKVYDCWGGDLNGKNLLIGTVGASKPQSVWLIVEYGGAIVRRVSMTCCPPAPIVRFTDEFLCYGSVASNGSFGVVDVTGTRPPETYSYYDEPTRICAPPGGYPVVPSGWASYVLGLGASRYPVIR